MIVQVAWFDHWKLSDLQGLGSVENHMHCLEDNGPSVGFTGNPEYSIPKLGYLL